MLTRLCLPPLPFSDALQDPQSADACLTSEDQQLDGRRLRIERAKVNRTLFLAKFSLSMTPPELRKIAESYGAVESVTIIKHHPSNKSKGCGFVKYHYREDAAEAFSGLKAKYKKWVIEWATSANDPELLGVSKNVVYVGGLPSNSITETILKNYFSTYGAVEDVSIVHPTQSMIKAQQTNSTQYSPLSSPNSASSSATSTSAGIGANVDLNLLQPANLLGVAPAEGQSLAPAAGSDASSQKAADSPTASTNPESPVPGIKTLTSYAFVTFTEPTAAAAAIENENGANFQGETIRVQYCETPDMKMRKKMSKLRDVYPNTMGSDNQGYPTGTIFPPQTQGVPYAYYPSHPAVVGPPVISGATVPYWVGQTPAGTTNNAESAGWYYVPPLQISIPQKDINPNDTASTDSRPSPITIPMGFHTFLHSPTYAPLGFPSAGQLSPLTSPIPLQPFFPLRIPSNPAPSGDSSPSTSSHHP